jgi:two-component system chemotaxis sensor kinase CheA
MRSGLFLGWGAVVNIKQLIIAIEQLTARLVSSDLSDPSDLKQFLKELSDLRADPQMKELPDPCRMIVSAATVVSMFKATAPKKVEAVLNCLLNSLTQVMAFIDRGEDPAEVVKAFGQEIKTISSGSAPAPVKTVSETQAREIPGFVSNTLSSLDGIEKGLLGLEKAPDDAARIDELFRCFHTIKGEANLLGVGQLVPLAHESEELLGLLRAKAVRADEAVSNVLLQAVDALRSALKSLAQDPHAACDTLAAALKDIKQLIAARKTAAVVPSVPVASASPVAVENKFVPQVPVLDLSSGPDLYMEFCSEAFEHLINAEQSVLKLESDPGDKEAINNIFRAFHTIKGAAGFLDFKDIRVLAHEAETMLDMVRKDTLKFEGRVVELTLSSVDSLRQLLTLLREQVSTNGVLKAEYVDVGGQIGFLKEVISGKACAPLGEIMIKQGSITENELKDALTIQKEAGADKKLGEILLDTHAASAKQVQSALETQKSGAPAENSIKIQLDKLDSLIDLVGELVISETQVIQSPQVLRIEDQKFHRNLAELDRITRSLQQIAMGMRLVPVGPTFQKMVRLVRDLSKKMGKEVSISLSGEETEIDKNMVELVGDPLMHMVRNSVDHGIESREVRVANGKPVAGKVQLSAFHRGSNVVIEIKDDGGGLRKDKILAKAIERGLIKEGDDIPDKRIFGMIFEAGFSTAEKVTDVSGRGVGMDVVRKNIEKLRGKIEIESVEGQGSTFSIYLPITLAIIEGIVIQAGQEKYILPINSVVEFIKPDPASLTHVYDKGEMFRAYGKVYPLIRLSKVFDIPHCRERFEDTTVCLIESDYGRACVLVDELLGQQQVVIKSLGESLRQVQGVSGAAILGDGRVGLILDVNGLVSLAVK